MILTPDSPSALPLLPGMRDRQLVLASASPRRQQLLGMLGLPLKIRPMDVEEVYPSSLAGADIPRFLSRKKAEAARVGIEPHEIILTSDTVVQLDGATLEKPGDTEEAVAMLMRLSGNTHAVTTAFSLIDGQHPGDILTDHDTTLVSFGHLTEGFARHYVEHHKPFDKAGAYGAQDLIGACVIHTLKGSFYTVMGLPMHKIFACLQSID